MKDPVFLVTGAADGLGLELCTRLASSGCHVLATDLDNHRLEEAARVAAWPVGLVRLAPLDVRQPRAWADAFALAGRAFGGVDVLVHTAIPLCARDAHACDVEAGTANALSAAAEAMLPRGGQVVVIAPGDALAAARARCLAADADLRARGLAVTAVCTGAVEALENGLALRTPTPCPGRLPAVRAERVVDAVLGPVLDGKPRQVFLPAYAGWLTRLAELVPALRARAQRPAVAPGPPAPAQRA